MNKLALFVSYVFHPLFLPIIVAFFFFNKLLMSNQIFGWIIYGIVFFNTLLLPYLFYNFIQKKNALKPNGQKKTILYSLGFNLYSYVLVAILIKYFGLGMYMESFFYAMVIITLVALVVSFFWKISLHMLGMGGILGFVLSYILLFNINTLSVFIIVLFFASIVAAARLMLQEHTSAQIYAGLLTGVALSMLTCYFNKVYYFSVYFN